MASELTRCDGCGLFIELRAYDFHILRCVKTTNAVEHATVCPECDETLFGEETCESVKCPFAAHTAGQPIPGGEG